MISYRYPTAKLNFFNKDRHRINIHKHQTIKFSKEFLKFNSFSHNSNNNKDNHQHSNNKDIIRIKVNNNNLNN